MKKTKTTQTICTTSAKDTAKNTKRTKKDYNVSTRSGYLHRQPLPTEIVQTNVWMDENPYNYNDSEDKTYHP